MARTHLQDPIKLSLDVHYKPDQQLDSRMNGIPTGRPSLAQLFIEKWREQVEARKKFDDLESKILPELFSEESIDRFLESTYRNHCIKIGNPGAGSCHIKEALKTLLGARLAKVTGDAEMMHMKVYTRGFPTPDMVVRWSDEVYRLLEYAARCRFETVQVHLSAYPHSRGAGGGAYSLKALVGMDTMMKQGLKKVGDAYEAWVDILNNLCELIGSLQLVGNQGQEGDVLSTSNSLRETSFMATSGDYSAATSLTITPSLSPTTSSRSSTADYDSPTHPTFSNFLTLPVDLSQQCNENNLEILDRRPIFHDDGNVSVCSLSGSLYT